MMQSKLKKFARSNEFIVLIILVLVMGLFSVLNPSFLTLRNLFDLFRTMIVTGIFALVGLLIGLEVYRIYGDCDLFRLHDGAPCYVTGIPGADPGSDDNLGRDRDALRISQCVSG